LATLEKMIEGVLSREGGNSESLVIQNHLAQIKLFGIRQGVELYPEQDDDNQVRRKFIDALYKSNKVDLFLDVWWDWLLCKGQICFYLRPTGTSYRLYAFDKDQHKAYYNADGDLSEVVIVYSYEQRNESMPGQDKWIRLRITDTEIETYETDHKPEFDYQMHQMAAPKTAINTLGFIPCVVVPNYIRAAGQKGVGEFEWLRSQIESHDQMLRSIKQNIKFFGNPTLVSSRSVGELTESGIGIEEASGNQRTVSSAGGFYGSTNSTARRDPVTGNNGYDDSALRIRRVVGRVAGDERFGYISPDPVSPDHSRYAAEYRENIHTALGGVDPLGVNTGATAYEIKSLYGRTAATAKKKAGHLYTHGLCKLFEMALGAEEHLFKQSIAIALSTEKEPVSPENVTDAIAMEALTNPELQKALAKGNWQPVGLPPLGDRTIQWRWLGPVFEDSPQDILQKSIVVRNLEEVGVETLKALEFLFSEKTEKERLAMLTGYPFREMQASGAALSQHLGIYSQLMSTPSPTDVNQPIGLTLNNLNVIQATIAHIQKRLSYGQQLQPATSSPSPSTSAPGDSTTTAVRPGSNDGTATIAGSPVPNSGFSGNAAPVSASPDGSGGGISYPSPAAAAGLFPPNFNQPYGGAESGVPTADGSGGSFSQPANNPSMGGSDFNQPIPVPGGTVSGTRVSATSQPLYQSYPATVPGVPADLLDKPGLLATLFPTFAAGLNAVTGSAKPQRDRKRKPNK